MIKFWTYKREYKKYQKALLNKIKKSIDSGIIFFGNELKIFEKNFIKQNKAKYGIAVGSGTDALLICLKSIGIKHGDEVITAANTAIPTISAIINAGAIPRLVDIGQDYLIDVKKITKEINKKTKAIIPVHLYGQSCEMTEIVKISKKYNIKIIEDASEALGSYYKKKHLGTFGDIGVVSFNGNKIITTGGGGAILTNNFNLYNKCFNLCTISRKGKNIWEYDYTKLGYNYRLPGLNASLGLAQLSKIKRYLLKKNIIYNHYKKYFSSSEITLMKNKKNFNNNNWLNAVFIKDSNLNLIKKIIITAQKKKIMLRPVWKLMHKIEYLKKYPRMKLKNSLIAEKSIITLPSGVDVFQK